jgi:hypothetical protein
LIRAREEPSVRPPSKIRSEIGVAARLRPDNDAEIDRLRAEYRASRAGEYLRRVVDDMPPLTAGQIDELQTILASAQTILASAHTDAGSPAASEVA